MLLQWYVGNVVKINKGEPAPIRMKLFRRGNNTFHRPKHDDWDITKTWNLNK